MQINLQIDIDATRTFLEIIAQDTPVTFQTFSDHGNNASLATWLHGELDQHLDTLTRLNNAGAGVFFMVNEGDGNGRNAAAVTRVRAVFIDMDGGGDLEAIMRSPLMPHIIVQSSSPGHLHAYWLVDDLPLAEFKQFQIGLSTRFGSDQAVKDLPRVMRLPGFFHVKGEPTLVSIVHSSPIHAYSRAELIDAFPEIYDELKKSPVEWVDLPTPHDYAPPEDITERIFEQVKASVEKKILSGAKSFRHSALLHVAFACLDNRISSDAATALMQRVQAFLPERDGGKLDWQEAQRALSWVYTTRSPGTPWDLRRPVIGRLSGPIDHQRPLLPPEYERDQFGALYAAKETKSGRRLDLLASRELHLDGIMHDIASEELYVRLSWEMAERTVSEVIPFEQAVTKSGLLGLAGRGAPVDELNAAMLTRYIQRYYAFNASVLPVSSITTRLGWVDDVFRLPGGAVPVHGIDEAPWGQRGTPQGWLEGLQALLGWGVTPALVIAASCAASPILRHLGLHTNPVLSLAGTSRSGKTTATAFALSIWANPGYNQALYFENATVNGLAAKIMAHQDLPIALDDVQRFEDRQVNELIHLLAGGAEKLRADRRGGARSARRWRGVALLTGETSALREAMGTGALNRLIELEDYPLGVPKNEEGLARANALHMAAMNYGSIRDQLLTLINELPSDVVFNYYAPTAAKLGVPGDMANTVGFIGYGVRALEALLGRDTHLPEDVMAYLGRALNESRESHGDLSVRAFEALQSFLASVTRGDVPVEGAVEINHQVVAIKKLFRGVPCWFVNPTHKSIREILQGFGGLDANLRGWAKHGLVCSERDTGGKRRLKHRIRVGNALVRWVGIEEVVLGEEQI